MTSGKFYMHKDAMDVCFEALKVFKISSTRHDVRAKWYNLGYMGWPWSVGVTHRMEIDPTNWIDVTHTMNNKRLKAGVPA